MATWDDVERLATALPEVTERAGYGNRTWRVKDKPFVWERPLRAKDRDELGARAPDGEVVAFALVDEGLKHALVADDPAVYFTTSHFDGYAAVLARLDDLDVDELDEQVTEAWLAKAPKRLADTYLAARDD